MNDTPTLLIIDDDIELTELLAGWLSQEGFRVTCCHATHAALELLNEKTPDGIILDVMFPDGSGLELLKKLREDFPTLPVLMLSARGEPLDRILGLEFGADDYLTKPCDPRELTARIRAILRRSTTPATSSVTPPKFSIGDLTFYSQRGVACIADKEIALTITESRLLEALLKQPGEPISKTELTHYVLGRAPVPYDRSLDVHASNLRKKLGAHADGRMRIIGLRSRGYFYTL
ncbi:MAG: response regulator transcription factor [Burkholderiales bacterium]|jgi:DNA-binding response OmpR family regulator|nr:response regulator transcription factor [Burkholderiales bacterium]